MNKKEISFDEFNEISSKLEILNGEVIDAELVPKSNGLKLTVKFGEDDIKTAFTNLGKYFAPHNFIGFTFPFLMNLTPTLIKGVNSEIMILVGERSDNTVDLYNNTYGSKLM